MNGYEHLGILFHLNTDGSVVRQRRNVKIFDGIVDVPYMCGKYRKSSRQELAKLMAT